MQQNHFNFGDIVKEKHRNIPMKITDVLPGKGMNDEESFSKNKYVCTWIENRKEHIRICLGADIQLINSGKSSD
jgi:hypothetical protein